MELRAVHMPCPCPPRPERTETLGVRCGGARARRQSVSELAPVLKGDDSDRALLKMAEGRAIVHMTRGPAGPSWRSDEHVKLFVLAQGRE